MTGRTVPNDYRRDQPGYAATVGMIRLLYGQQPPDGTKRIEFFQQFGWLGYVAHVYEPHFQFIDWLNDVMDPVGHAFDPIIIHRWRLMNHLILASQDHDDWLRSEALPPAAMAGFPLLEEVARRLSGFWNEEGVLLSDPPAEIAFRSLSDADWRPRTGYTESKRIVELAHKLQLMQWSLPEAFRKSFDKLHEIVDRPAIAGADQPDANLFERLQYSRDVRSHGLRWEGIDAWWITLVIALLYFRLPPYSAPELPDIADEEK